MIIYLTLPSKVSRNLKVAGLGKKQVYVLNLVEELKRCWGSVPVSRLNICFTLEELFLH